MAVVTSMDGSRRPYLWRQPWPNICVKYAALRAAATDRPHFKAGDVLFTPVNRGVSKTTYTATLYAAANNWPIPIWVVHTAPEDCDMVLWEDCGRRELAYVKVQARVTVHGESEPRKIEVTFTRIEDWIDDADADIHAETLNGSWETRISTFHVKEIK